MVGCAGGGEPAANGGGGGGGGGGGTGRVGSTVNLLGQNGVVPPGLVDVYLLPGQGRNPGDKTVSISLVRLLNGTASGDFSDNQSPIIMPMDLFNVQSVPINAGVQGPQAVSVNLTDLQFGLDWISREDDFGNQTRFNADGTGGAIRGSTINILGSLGVTAFPGRISALQLNMNGSMVDETVNGSGTVTRLDFNENTFTNANINPSTGKINSFLSDYMEFDISAVAGKPTLMSPSVAGLPAQRVFISGDSYALSVKDPVNVNGSAGVFEVLTKFGTFEGFFRAASPTTQLKTYELKQADPSQVPALRLITALKGIYRDFTEVISNASNFEFITFPKTGDGTKQEIAIVSRTGSTISNMWFGTADFLTKKFRVYPIKNVQPASTANEVTGTLSGFANASNSLINTGGANWWQSVRYGNYSFDTAPAGVPADKRSGSFLVFRS